MPEVEVAHSGAEYEWRHDEDGLFTFLGVYLATFQWIEAKLDQIILLDAGHDLWAETQDRLAKMRNEQKISAVFAAVIEGNRFRKAADRPDWRPRFEELRVRLSDERLRRNSIMHSQYLLEGVEQGFPAIRSDRQRSKGKAHFHQEEMTKDRMDQILQELANLAFAVGQVHQQLIHVVE
ncbi:MAG TPA: hypothetical protein VGD23_05795 [Sphingomicrobium sp.]